MWLLTSADAPDFLPSCAQTRRHVWDFEDRSKTDIAIVRSRDVQFLCENLEKAFVSSVPWSPLLLGECPSIEGIGYTK